MRCEGAGEEGWSRGLLHSGITPPALPTSSKCRADWPPPCREFGIRLVLGSTPGEIRRLVLREGLVTAGIGIVGLPPRGQRRALSPHSCMASRPPTRGAGRLWSSRSSARRWPARGSRPRAPRASIQARYGKSERANFHQTGPPTVQLINELLVKRPYVAIFGTLN